MNEIRDVDASEFVSLISETQGKLNNPASLFPS
jgi:hypothetical protein